MARRMNLATLMMLRDGGGNGDGRRNEYREGGRREPYDMIPYMPPYMPPYGEPGMRRRGYPMGEYDGDGVYDRRRRYPRGEYDGEGMTDRRMGFGEDDDDIGMRRRNEGGRMHYGRDHESREPVRFGGMIAMEGGRHGEQKMTREIAEEWTENMNGMDPAKPHGAKWTPEQVKPIATKYGVPTEGERFWEFYAVMNAMYSDYYAVAKKYNAQTPDFFADMAMAFINDKDAVENKTMMYYECIVER